MSKTAAQLTESIEIMEHIEMIQHIKDTVNNALGELQEILDQPRYRNVSSKMKSYGNYGLDQFLNNNESNPYDLSVDTIIFELRNLKHELND